ncbi:hypothetical protein [Streptococcus pluranimalium]|uniref:hypothetical protein n=1 Tax=Streptococcus pluranimalium TaxID=82348 RepID=UPI0039FB9264
MKLYHATPVDNMAEIFKFGLKATNGMTFLAESENLARAFAVTYNWTPYAIFEVTISPNAVVRSYDHNEDYFKELINSDTAKCYMTFSDIPKESIKLMGVWEFDKFRG